MEKLTEERVREIVREELTRFERQIRELVRDETIQWHNDTQNILRLRVKSL